MNKNSESPRPALVVMFGARMRKARELNGFSQLRAARLLGYQNSSKLNRVELASDTNSIPFWLIPKAAEVYRVSADFLLGLSDAWECNHSAALQSQIACAIEQTDRIQNNAIQQLFNLVESIESAVSTNLRRTTEFKDIVTRFRCLNAGFDTELKLGAKLLRVANETSQEAAKISRQLAEYRKSIKSTIN